MPGWGDSGPDHTGFGDVWSEDSGMRQTTAVHLDGTLVVERTGSAAYVWDAPADEHTYRVVTDTALDAARWPLATRGHTEWTFRSAATPEDHWTYLPLINLAYDIRHRPRRVRARRAADTDRPQRRVRRRPRAPAPSAGAGWRCRTTTARPGGRCR